MQAQREKSISKEWPAIANERVKWMKEKGWRGCPEALHAVPLEHSTHIFQRRRTMVGLHHLVDKVNYWNILYRVSAHGTRHIHVCVPNTTRIRRLGYMSTAAVSPHLHQVAVSLGDSWWDLMQRPR